MFKCCVYPKRMGALILVSLITLTRFPLIIIFAQNLIEYLEIGNQSNGLTSIVISMFILFSDFIDGKIARKYCVSTKLGQIFDIYLDFIYIFVGLSILGIYKVIDLYFIMVIVYKFLEFIISSKMLKGQFISKKGRDYYYDRLGTLVSCFYYVIPVMVISFIYFKVNNMDIIISIILTCVTLLTIIASFAKFKEIILYCTFRKQNV